MPGSNDPENCAKDIMEINFLMEVNFINPMKREEN